jgi:hypothetical protein
MERLPWARTDQGIKSHILFLLGKRSHLKCSYGLRMTMRFLQEPEHITPTHFQENFHHGRFSCGISPESKPNVGTDVFVSFRILSSVSIRLTRFLKDPGSITKRGPAPL